MDNNIEKKEENDKKSGDDELESTKESLFADLTEMEDEITTEAIELVEHALSLVDSQYFDDAIEILRQAISLYSDLGRNDEIDTINQKISEIYILKEQVFKEVESKSTKSPEELEAQYIDQEQIIEKSVEDLSYTPEILIEEAHKLVEIDEFDEAIDKYDEAIKLFREYKKDSEIEKVYELIDKCYNAKAEFLKKPKEDLSHKAEDLIEEANQLVKRDEFDEAIDKYDEAIKLFREYKKDSEIESVYELFDKCYDAKAEFLKKPKESSVDEDDDYEYEYEEEI